MQQPVLSVEHLNVSVRTADGWCPIVRDLSIEVAAGETLCLVGESGCGKSLTALAIMRLLPRGARIDSGRIGLGGVDLAALDEPALRDMRGRDLAMIFQEPMTSLNPVMTIGEQITEGVQRHERVSSAAARARALELFNKVRIPDPRTQAGRLSASIVRRDAPARDDRHGAGLPAQAVARRRADHGARRHHSGADPGDDGGAARRDRNRCCLHHPRSRRRRRDRRSRRRALCRQDRRADRRGVAVRQCLPSLYARPDALDPAAVPAGRRRGGRSPDRDQGHGAGADRGAERLRLLAALRVRHPTVCRRAVRRAAGAIASGGLLASGDAAVAANAGGAR